ncbi:MAG TPA: lysozyme inhibitor LprI family protein [Pyrinomonadaceae bacterium]
MKLLFLPALLLLIISNGPKAQQKDPCAGETTFEMRQCAGKKYKQADDELNKIYQRLMSKLSADEKASLKTAQQAWLKYRDTNCDFESFLYRGGTMAPLVGTQCLVDMTILRTKELKQQIEDMERE